MIKKRLPRWTVEAHKYNGDVHYRMAAHLVADDGAGVQLRTVPDGILHHITRGRTHPINRRSDLYFWRDRWYNVFMHHTPDGTFTHFYCNIGLPPQISDTTVTFVDLDLDVVMNAEGGVEVLDTDEFKRHTVKYGYPVEVQRQAREAVLDVLVHWRARRPPFDQEIVAE
ncbi:MAG: DUF402 domain-containing protein [Anaerolineae bacterium]|nr:DUF402 domain-containing protein [Anaerolineae bacterium]